MYASQFERYELKYLLNEQQAGVIRRALLPWCAVDPHNADGESGGYPIFSLYLDTPDMRFHEAKLRDDPERFKLRVRSYAGGKVANLEIKRKHKEVILKSRVAVAAADLEEAVYGGARPIYDEPDQWQTLEGFGRLMYETGARPQNIIRYEREAFVSEVDEYARVTFDRRICAQPADGWNMQGDANEWTMVDGAWHDNGLDSPVVLEVKCEWRMPNWLQVLLRRYELDVCGFSKYSTGVEMLRRQERGLDQPANREELYDGDG